MNDQPWTAGDLVALDLEGTGGQDRQDEKILEIAAIPLAEGHPDMEAAWDSKINPGRWISPRPWISRDLTGTALTDAPTLDKVTDVITEKLHGRILVGHNIGVDWRLIRLRLPHIKPAGLLDTTRLVRHLLPDLKRWSLTAMLTDYGLEEQVTKLVPDGKPHRALWDAVGAALLLAELINNLPGGSITLAGLTRIAGVRVDGKPRPVEDDQLVLDLEPDAQRES